MLAAIVSLATLGGCSDNFGLGPPDQYVKPTVAVMKFENRAPMSMGWNLGDGTADVLVDKLMATGRYHVVERAELGEVAKELKLQQSGVTRPELRAQKGRVKNAQYLIKGTITDFGIVSGDKGFMGLGGLDFAGGGNRAVMGVTVYVIDVESGEIVCSNSFQESLRAGDAASAANYKSVAFGGSTFYSTPLGKATEKVVKRAVKEITLAIAARPWEPKVAKVQTDGTVLVSGGSDRRVALGSEYQVIRPGEPVTNPDTGDVIGQTAGAIVAHIRIRMVYQQYSEAEVTSGRADAIAVGQRCMRVQTVARR
jgi:curli biogenesis system outer membrane secretion channel CsgG